jgi:type II secretory pathway pseudopilin PulG
MHRKNSSHAGFTLIELAASIIIVAFIIGGMMSMQSQNVRVTNAADLEEDLKKIDEALYRYRVTHQGLPCPGDSRLAPDDPKYGWAADGAPGACNAGETISSNLNTTNNAVFGGLFPFNSLNVKLKYTYLYYVVNNITQECNLTGSTRRLKTNNWLKVKDASGAEMSGQWVAVVVHLGSDDHGKFLGDGESRYSAGSTNEKEHANCMCNENANTVHPSRLTVYTQPKVPDTAGDPKTMFDDIVRAYRKQDFYLESEKMM